MIKVNGEVLKTETFPNGEIKIKDFKVESENNISFKFHSCVDIVNLIMIKSHIDENNSRANNYLHINYFPFSRMDRTIKGDLFTLKGMCKLINDMNFDIVYTSDNHSNVTDALLDRNVNKTMIPVLLKEVEKEFDIDFLFYPDLGALKRYRFDNYKSLVGEKDRDPFTGWITKYEVREKENLIEKNIVIIDDLCSGGKTFELASIELNRLGANKIILCVSHVEENIFNGSIFKENSLIDCVYSTNSIIDSLKSFEKLKIVKVF